MKYQSLSVAVFLALAFPLLAASPTVETKIDNRLPGVQLSETLTEITGVATSPMLGVTAVGTWKYLHTPSDQREALPWFCNPWVWGIGWCLLGLCFLKDAFGTASPPLLKKPFDLAELCENKASALVASAAFVPVVVPQIMEHFHASAGAPGGDSVVLAMIPLDARLLLVPVAILTFGIVWLSAHAINVLVLLSPFGVVDACLKLVKGSMLVGLVGAYFVHPLLGAAVSVFIIVVACLLAPWSFRLTIFGCVIAHDLILKGRARRRANHKSPHVFISRKLGGVPVRTYGTLTNAGGGKMIFVFRPFLVLPMRKLELDTDRLVLVRGIFFSSLGRQGGPSPVEKLLDFPPRYQEHESNLMHSLEISTVQDGKIVRGLKSMYEWLGTRLAALRRAMA